MLTPIRNYLKKRQLARASTSTPTPTPTPSTATSTTTNTTTNATCRKLQKAKILKTEPSCTLEPRPRKILSLVKQYEVNLSKNFDNFENSDASKAKFKTFGRERNQPIRCSISENESLDIPVTKSNDKMHQSD